MRGTILGYDSTSHTGAISGHDGNRYDFARDEWKSPGTPAKGMLVDFVPVDGRATKIYVVESERSESWLGFLFSSSGRIPRKRYWLSYVLPMIGLSVVAAMIDTAISAGSPERVGLVGALVSLFFLWPSFAVVAKRLHDRGMSGWWALFANGIVPIIVLAVAAYWYYTKMKGPGAPAETTADPTSAMIFALVCLALVIVWLYFVIQVGFIRGQVGENRYGDDPLPTPADVRSDGVVTAIFAVLIVLCLAIPVLAVASYWYYTKKLKAPEDISQPLNEPTQGEESGGAEPSQQPSTEPSTPAESAPPAEPSTPPVDAPPPADPTPPADGATPPAE